jgi:hypothetical protein
MRKLQSLWAVLTSRNYIIVCDAGLYGGYKKWQHAAFMKAVHQMFDEIEEQNDVKS